MNKIMGLLTMARRAGKLSLGMDMCKESCKSGSSKGICTAVDISPKSLKEIKFVCLNENVPLYSLGIDMETVGVELGKKVGIISVNDGGFMKKAKNYMKEIEIDDDTFNVKEVIETYGKKL